MQYKVLIFHEKMLFFCVAAFFRLAWGRKERRKVDGAPFFCYL